MSLIVRGESILWLEADDRTSSVQCTDGKSYDISSDLLKIASVTVTEHGKILHMSNRKNVDQ